MIPGFQFKKRRGEDTCEVQRCRNATYIRVLGRNLCREHWEEHCDREVTICP